MNFMSLRVKPQKWISPSKTQYNDSIFEDKSFKFVFRIMSIRKLCFKKNNLTITTENYIHFSYCWYGKWILSAVKVASLFKTHGRK